MTSDPKSVSQAKQTKKKPARITLNLAIRSSRGPATISKEGVGPTGSPELIPPKCSETGQFDFSDPSVSRA